MSRKDDITGYFLRDTTKLQDKSKKTKPKKHERTNDVQTVSDTATKDMAAIEDTVSNAELKTLILRMEATLGARLDKVEDELKSIKEGQKQNVEEIEGLKHRVADNEDGLKEIIEEKLPTITDAIRCDLNKFKELLTLQEIHNRKANLLFYGIEESENENVFVELRKAWRKDFDMSEEEVNTIGIAHAHRLPRKEMRAGTPNPLIVRFVHMEDRDWFLYKARNRPFIKDRKPVVVYTDLPAEMKRERGKLAAKAKELRRTGKQTRIRVVGTRVVLEYRSRIEKGEGRGEQRAWDRHRDV